MRHDQHCPLARKTAQNCQKITLGLRVEGRGWFIHQYDGTCGKQCSGNADALRFAA